MPSTQAHTPGPWRVGNPLLGAGEYPVFADEAPAGLKMPAMADTPANAHLIAAAPDLLAACEDALSRLEDISEFSNGKDETIYLRAYPGILRTAIESATGGGE